MIDKSVKAALGFYNELRKARLYEGSNMSLPASMPSQAWPKGLMQAHRQVTMGRLRA